MFKNTYLSLGLNVFCSHCVVSIIVENRQNSFSSHCFCLFVCLCVCVFFFFGHAVKHAGS